MRTPRRGTKPRKSTLASIPVSTAGWISNRNLALPNGTGHNPGAQILDNWFPTASSVRLRRGLMRHATMPANIPVGSIFTYSYGQEQKMFAANSEGIWDVTVPVEPNSVILVEDNENYLSPDGADEAFGWFSIDPDDSLWTSTDGEWVTIQFSTAGGTFMIGVNGKDEAFIYDGLTFDSLNVTFPSGVTLDTTDLSFVWAYKKRIYFVQKDSLSAWYLPVDSIGGQLVELPLGGVFNRGGTLLWGQTWSLSSGGDGGLSEQNVFTTTEGEVAIYQGMSPDDADTWSKVGIYRIGTPMGKKAFVRAGGDLVVATTIGFIPLSKAIQMDYAALGIAAISASIADEWREAVASRGSERWVCELWGEGSMLLVSPPRPTNTDPVVLVANSDTGAWCRFTGWDVYSMAVFRGGIYIGDRSGGVFRGWQGGTDDGKPYTGIAVPLFTDIGSPGQRKIAKVARVVKRSRYAATEKVDAIFDWDATLPAVPDASVVPLGNEWGNAIWGESVWGGSMSSFITDDWHSVGGSGFAVSLVVQVTSGYTAPLDVEIVRFDLTYETADIVS